MNAMTLDVPPSGWARGHGPRCVCCGTFIWNKTAWFTERQDISESMFPHVSLKLQVSLTSFSRRITHLNHSSHTPALEHHPLVQFSSQVPFLLLDLHHRRHPHQGRSYHHLPIGALRRVCYLDW